MNTEAKKKEMDEKGQKWKITFCFSKTSNFKVEKMLSIQISLKILMNLQQKQSRSVIIQNMQ